MIEVWVELSGENPALARAELQSVVAIAGGTEPAKPAFLGRTAPLSVALPSIGSAELLAGRVALGHRVYLAVGSTRDGGGASALRRLGQRGGRRRFRVHSGSGDDGWRPLVETFRASGGIVDLELDRGAIHLFCDQDRVWWIAEELAAIDRAAYEARRPSRLPFRRPVTLPPRLGRVLVNLARVRANDRVVDPFVGTGALLAEAALVGARVTGVDQDAAMIRGALHNFEFLGLDSELFRVADAGQPVLPPGGTPWDALVTDPPYGRASSSAGEPAAGLLSRVLREWAPVLSPQARIALAMAGAEPLDLPDWALELEIPQRAHRSLTRRFRVYRRSRRISGPDRSPGPAAARQPERSSCRGRA